MAWDEPIRIAVYDPTWPTRFERERVALTEAIGAWAVGGIHHIGSTAVPGLDAKPTVDILVGVEDLETSRACFDRLAALDYLYAPYLSEEMHWFCKPDPSRRTHHLHLVPRDSPRFRDELAFRDLLRSDPQTASAYAELKRGLATRFKHDRDAYTDGKSEFIRQALGSHYDRIGTTYTEGRRADPRIAAQIDAALGDAETVVNVGAGTGSYEPAGREVTAIEPSAVMIAQRPPGSAPAIQAHAEKLPLKDNSVDAAMAIISDHHWSNREAGLREMLRIARHRVVLLNADPGLAGSFWLTRDYLLGFADLIPPPYRRPGYWEQELRGLLGKVEIQPVPVPHDCQDGFYQAYWRRPHAYLDPKLRDSISVFHRLPAKEASSAMERLHSDLDDGSWEKRHGHLLQEPELDLGLRLVVAELKAPTGIEPV